MFWQWPVRTLGRLTLMFVKLRSSWGLRLTSTDYTSLSGQLKGPAGHSLAHLMTSWQCLFTKVRHQRVLLSFQ